MGLRLSIIIPVYNTEKWVGRCLESCLQQDIAHEEYEIIVVNDGTPDGAMAVVRGYALKYGNIRIVEQENGGLSSARNAGMAAAEGEYVWFVDSDDYIERDCLSALLVKAEREELDVLCFKPYLLFEDGKREVFEIPFEEDGKRYEGTAFIVKVGMPPAAWCAIYRRGFLSANGLRYMEGIYHEDQEYTPRAYCLAKRISYVDRCVYDYYQREGSIMKSVNPRKAKDLLKVADSLYAFVGENIERDSVAYDVMINKVSFAFAQSLRNCGDVSSEELDRYREKAYYPLSINDGLSTKEKMKYRLINISLGLYMKTYKAFKL